MIADAESPKAMLEVRSHDPNLRRKGRVLAVILLGMAATVTVLAVFNTVQGYLYYNTTNGVLLALTLGLLVLNRFGFVRTAGLFTVLLSAAGAFLLVWEEPMAAYLAMTLPILVASSLLVPWGGFVVSAMMIACAVVLDVANPSLLILVIVAIISYLFADTLDRAYRESRHQAFHDPLTGLPNRALFLDRLEQAISRAERSRERVAVLFSDVDNFKVINDSLGHEIGDELLVQLGQRIRDSVRPGDTAARLGGDEFVVLLEGVADVSDAVYAADRILESLRAPFDLGGREITVATSTGIALNDSAHTRPANLLRDADVAMYQAKKNRTRHRVFHSDMNAWALKRLELEGDLRRAIERGDFEVYYQPKVLLGTGRTVGVEALVRWGNSERGSMMPSEFIPLAEETGLIVPIGEQVLEKACRQAKEWHERSKFPPGLNMSVNLSVRQFQELDLVDTVCRTLQRTGLKAESLQLEITESALMENERRAIGTLRKLKALGVKVAIDDFGKGYSSLNYLRDLPADSLKIDKSFVDGIDKDEPNAAIVRLIIELAHTLGLEVTAEGIETVSQLTRLLNMGCDLGQGYYFSRPLPVEQAATFIAAELLE